MLLCLFFLECAGTDCSELWPQQFSCDIDECRIGSNVTTTCNVSNRSTCTGNRSLEMEVECIYCWQLSESSLKCFFAGIKCKPGPRPQSATCTALPTVFCLGNRTFMKQMYCQSSSGYSLKTAIILSLFFGGLGIDRFYLGYTAIGFAKLLSLGGFGVWSLLDVIFIICGAVGPQDGTIFKEQVSDS